MNLTQLRNRRIDRDNIDDLIADGLISQEEAEALTEDFIQNMRLAIETKGYATPADIRPVPYSEILRRFRKGESHAAAGMGS